MDRQAISKTIKKAFIWWGNGLLAWLPDTFTQKIQLQPTIRCLVDGDQVTLCLLNKKGAEQDTLVFDFSSESSDKVNVSTWIKRYKKYDIVLLLSKQYYLVKKIQLPAQAKDNLAEMIQLEVDRQTPFSVAEIYHGYRINEQGNTLSKSLFVTLAVAPKSFVNNIVGRLGPFSLPISSLRIAEKEQEVINIPLVANEDTPKDPIRLNILLSSLMLILAMLLFYKPVAHYQQALDLIQPEILQAKKQAMLVRDLEQQNELMVERIQFLDAKLLDHRLRLDILNELAQVLPRHTWLERSEFNGNKLSLYGRSELATELIPLLTKTGHFQAVRFTAPLTRDVQSNKDRFKLEAVIVSRERLNDGL